MEMEYKGITQNTFRKVKLRSFGVSTYSWVVADLNFNKSPALIASFMRNSIAFRLFEGHPIPHQWYASHTVSKMYRTGQISAQSFQGTKAGHPQDCFEDITYMALPLQHASHELLHVHLTTVSKMYSTSQISCTKFLGCQGWSWPPTPNVLKILCAWLFSWIMKATKLLQVRETIKYVNQEKKPMEISNYVVVSLPYLNRKKKLLASYFFPCVVSI